MYYAKPANHRALNMGEQVIEISTEVFRLLKKKAPAYISLSDEKPGPTQRILVEEDIYNEFIDRAIANRKTLDQVVTEVCIGMGRGLGSRVPPFVLQRMRGE